MMKQILLLLLMAMFIVVPGVSALVDTEFNLNVDEAGVKAYDCLDSGCNTVRDFSGEVVIGETTSGKLNVVFPSSVASNHGYALIFYSQGYAPRAYTADLHSNGDSSIFNISYDIDFDKVNECQAVVDEFVVINDAHANEPLQINVSSSLSAVTSSAFRQTDVGVGYIPPELMEEHYSARTDVTLTIENEDGNVVLREVKELNIMADEQEDLSFSWTAQEEGRHNAIVVSQVIDDQCESTIDTNSSKEFTVLPGRPTNEYYTLINKLDISNEYPVANDTVTFSFEKISNYADINHRLYSVPTEAEYTIYDEDNDVVFSKQEILPKNPNTVDYTMHSFDWTPIESGSYTIVVDAKARETMGAHDNLAERAIIGLTVKEEPVYAINFQVRDNIDGMPVTGAVIEVSSQNIITDAEGKAKAVELDPGTYRYTAHHPDYKAYTGSVRIVDTDMDEFFVMVRRDSSVENSTITIVNAPPTVAYVNVIYEFDLDAVSSQGNEVLFRKLSGPQGLSMESDGRIEWLPLPNDLGKQKVLVLATDGISNYYYEWTIDVKSRQDGVDEGDDRLNIMSIRLPNGENIRPGDVLAVSVLMRSENDRDDVDMTISVPELALRRSTTFDIDDNDESSTVLIPIARNVRAGEYMMRIAVTENGETRIKYRPFYVTTGR